MRCLENEVDKDVYRLVVAESERPSHLAVAAVRHDVEAVVIAAVAVRADGEEGLAPELEDCVSDKTVGADTNDRIARRSLDSREVSKLVARVAHQAIVR